VGQGLIGLLSRFDGLPFVDDDFAAGRLLAAVAAVRTLRGQELLDPADPRPFSTVLRPDTAAAIRHKDVWLDLPSAALTPDEQDAVRRALQTLTALQPSWRPLLAVPIQHRKLLASSAISASSFAWPQHLFLGDAAFASDVELTEQVLHEMSHCWLYFLEELCALQHDRCTHTFTLPSGTSHRRPNEVIGAIHVVVNLRRMYRAMPRADTLERRLDALQEYLHGCLELAEAMRPCLTPDGRELLEHLATAGRTAAAT